jgi:hypothetical protein
MGIAERSNHLRVDGHDRARQPRVQAGKASLQRSRRVYANCLQGQGRRPSLPIGRRSSRLISLPTNVTKAPAS